MTVSSTGFQLNQIVQSRQKPGTAVQLNTVSSSSKTSATEKGRSAARRTTNVQPPSQSIKKVQVSNPSTAQPVTQKKQVKRKTKKSSMQSRPNPFGGTSARTPRENKVQVSTAQSLQGKTRNPKTSPVKHKKITIG